MKMGIEAEPPCQTFLALRADQPVDLAGIAAVRIRSATCDALHRLRGVQLSKLPGPRIASYENIRLGPPFFDERSHQV